METFLSRRARKNNRNKIKGGLTNFFPLFFFKRSKKHKYILSVLRRFPLHALFFLETNLPPHSSSPLINCKGKRKITTKLHSLSLQPNPTWKRTPDNFHISMSPIIPSPAPAMVATATVITGAECVSCAISTITTAALMCLLSRRTVMSAQPSTRWPCAIL